MPKFEVSAPSGKKYEVTAPDGATEQDAIEYVKRNYFSQPQAPIQAPQQQESGLGRAAQLIGSELAPYAVGAATGAALGSAVPGLGTVAGGLAGLGAAAATDIATSIGGAFSQGVKRPSEVYREIFGIAQPATQGEQILGTAAGAFGGSAGVSGAARQLLSSAKPAFESLRTRVLQLMSEKAAGQAVASAATSAGAKKAEQEQFGPVGQFVSGLAASTVPFAAAGTVKAAANPKGTLSRLLGVDAEKFAAFEAGGVSPTIADVTNSPAISSAYQGASRVPFASSFIDRAEEAKQGQIKQSLERLGIGRAVTEEEASGIISGAALRESAKLKNQSSKNYDAFYKFFSPEERFSASNFDTEAFKIGSETMNLAGGLRERVTGGAGQRILNEIAGDSSAGMNFESLKTWRTVVGKQIEAAKLNKTEDEAVFSRIYSALSDDMREAAKQKGPEALAAFNKANDFHRESMRKIESTFQKLVDKKDVSSAFTDALSGSKRGGNRLARVVNALNDDEKEIIQATVIDRLGQPSPGLQKPDAQNFSPSTLVTNWNKLSPSAKNALFPKDKALRADLDRFVGTMQQIKESGRAKNTSNTANILIASSMALLPFTPAGASAAVSAVGGASLLSALFSNKNFVAAMGSAALSRQARINKLRQVAIEDPGLAPIVQAIIRQSGIDAATNPQTDRGNNAN